MKQSYMFVLTAALALAAPALSLADQSTDDRIAALEKRVAALEAQLGHAKAQPVVLSPGNAKDLANWRQLHKGMPSAEVERLLGSPKRVAASIALVTWYYEAGAVEFGSDGKHVDGWREP